MTTQMLLHQMLLIFLLCLCHGSSSIAAQLELAKAGCDSKCGEVSIPYPFGIGSNPNCSFDDWFQIDCNNSFGYFKPILTRAKLEVLNISISNGTLLVNSPVTFFCNISSETVTNLTGSPFVYSHEQNIFTALSCNHLAVVSSLEFVAGGCRSTCDQDSARSQGLNCDIGVNCCQTGIPPYLTAIGASLNGETTTDCEKLAFLVEKEWFKRNTSKSSSIIQFTKEMKRKGEVPVVLDWRIKNDARVFELYSNFIVSEDQYWIDVTYGHNNYSSGYGYDYNYTYYSNQNLSTVRDPHNPSCKVYNSPTINRSEIVCSCYRGFEGNPYLGLASCNDTNECKDPARCFGRKCVNKFNGYSCEDDKKNKTTSIVEDNKKNKTTLIVAAGLSSSLGLLLLLIAAWFGYKFVKRRNEIKRKKIFFKRNGGLLLEQQLLSGTVNVDKIKLFKSRELEKSTDNFNTDRILGQGGQGTVYKGMLEDGKIVAVKKSKVVDESQLSEFINEIVILSQLNHRNIVQVLGCCLETEVPILVYEFIPNGTLSGYIAEQIEEFPLTWKIRLRIATEIAGALSHLHYTASFPIYHRDIKSTNILLDEKYRAKVADFGTSRSIAIDQTHLTTSLVHGTFGYLDPEYFQSSQFTEKSDVYSFGVVLVELLTGQKPISLQRSENEGKSLATYFIISMQKDCLFEIVDPQVLKDGPKKDILAVANLARRCLNLSGRKRPTMREVMTELEGIQKTEKSSGVEQNHEEVEYLRTDLVEPWDIASSSSGTGAGRISSFMEIPLLSFKSV